MVAHVDLNEQEIKMLIDILRFSIAACPLDSISSQEVEIDADMIDKLISKMENALKWLWNSDILLITLWSHFDQTFNFVFI